MLFGKCPYANLPIEHLAGGWDDARVGNGRQKHNFNYMFFVLHITLVLRLCSRKVVTIAVAYQSEPLLVNVDISNCFCVFIPGLFGYNN